MRRTEVLQGIRLMKFEEILERTRFRELSQGEAASVPGVSERTFLRWRVRFEAEGERRDCMTAAWGGRRRAGCRWTR